MRPERRRHADENRIGRREPRRIRSCDEPLGTPRRGDPGVDDVAERAPPCIETGKALGVGVETHAAEPGYAGAERKRQSDIAEPDDYDHCLAIGKTGREPAYIRQRCGTARAYPFDDQPWSPPPIVRQYWSKNR